MLFVCFLCHVCVFPTVFLLFSIVFLGVFYVICVSFLCFIIIIILCFCLVFSMFVFYVCVSVCCMFLLLFCCCCDGCFVFVMLFWGICFFLLFVCALKSNRQLCFFSFNRGSGGFVFSFCGLLFHSLLRHPKPCFNLKCSCLVVLYVFHKLTFL